MNLTRMELEILAGEREKYPRELVGRCLKSFKELGLLRGEELTSRGVEVLEPYRMRRAIFIAAGIGNGFCR